METLFLRDLQLTNPLSSGYLTDEIQARLWVQSFYPATGYTNGD